MSASTHQSPPPQNAHREDPDSELIAAQWDFADSAGSMARFIALLDQPPFDRDRPKRAEVLTQVARCLGLQRRFDDAHAVLAQALDLLTTAASRALVRVLLERGRLHNSASHPDRGRGDFARAWDIAREIHQDALAVDAAHMLAIIETGPAIDEWNTRALDLARRSADPDARRWVASIANNIGWSRLNAGRSEDALEYFRIALAERRAQANPGGILIARWCIARCQRALGDLDAALAEQRALLEAHQRAGTADGFVHEELAECLLARGQPDAAAPHFAKAHALLSIDPLLSIREPTHLARLAELGRRHG